MSLQPGTKLGTYEILAPLGAGGMGEVYRAKDDRLGRNVAVKVLPPAFSSDLERLRRFEQEARAAGQLNHPNIVAVFDVGRHAGAPYIVSELLEGESLRSRLLAGALPARRAIDFARQIAEGLAAAHERNIVHRDVKPDNLFITKDGRIKILDFGIAKLTRAEGPEAREDTRTVPASLTATGAILGTASYMAPEQIRGQPTDHRADLFALGAIVYELLTGRKAFEGETPADRMSAILTAEPPPLSSELERTVPGLGVVIRRCIEKRPDARFDSARDLAFTLRVLLEAAARREDLPAGSPGTPESGIRFHRLTFREGLIDRAQFAPDGETIVFGASWEGEPLEVYMTRVGSPEARPIGLGNATLLSISDAGEMAVLLRPRDLGGFIQLGVLARVPLIGGAPRELLTDVMHASWSPDGRSLAVVREVQGTFRLEYPIGKVLHVAAGWISEPCVSPDGKKVAFLSHPARGDNSGDVLEVGATGEVRTVASGYQTIWGLNYSPTGEELIFSGNLPWVSTGILAVNREGNVRRVHPTPGFSAIEDFSRSDRALFHQATSRMRMEFQTRDGAETRELSWLEWSLVRDVSPDGKWVLFDETGPGGGERHSVFLRPTSGGSAIRLADGVGARFSPDGAWVSSLDRIQGDRVNLLPAGAGESVTLDLGGRSAFTAGWIPGTDQLYVVAAQQGGPLELCRLDIATRTLEPISREPLQRASMHASPAGRALLAMNANRQYTLFPFDGGTPEPLPWIGPEERVARYSEDGRYLYVWERNRIPVPVHRAEVATGRREPWCEITPRQRSGVNGLNNLCASPDGEIFVSCYVQRLGVLHVVEGLR